MADFHPLEYAGKHPLIVGAGVFVGGLVVLGMLGVFSSGSGQAPSGDASEVQGYFAAESAQAQAGDQVDIAAITTQGATQQAYLNDNASMNINSTWATAQTSMNASNNAAALAAAPFQVQTAIAGALGQIASAPPTTVTNSSSSSGFFGIGAGSKTTTSVIPNAGSSQAVGALTSWLGDLSPAASASQFNAGH